MATSETGPDTWRAKFTQMMHSTYTIYGMALGNELGLIQAMGELDKPVTATELAEKTDCKERYVLEWLLLMAMADVFEMDDTGTKFNIPKGSFEGLSEVANETRWVPVFGVTHQHLVDAFKTSGPRGVPQQYGESCTKSYEHLHDDLWPDLSPSLVKAIPGLQACLENGGECLDIGCATGGFNITMAGLYPRSTFIGVDPSSKGILEACETASSRGVKNARFVEGDAAALPGDWSAKFDAIFIIETFHDIPFATKACDEIRRALKPGGVCIVVDVNVPSDPQAQKKTPFFSTEIYCFSLYYCLSQSMNTEGSEALGAAMGSERIVKKFEEAALKRIPGEELSLPEKFKYALVFKKE